MASAKFLEEALSTDVDESAVSAIVGSLENQLVTSTPPAPGQTGSTIVLNQNHINNSSAISNGGTTASNATSGTATPQPTQQLQQQPQQQQQQKHGNIANGDSSLTSGAINNTADGSNNKTTSTVTNNAMIISGAAAQTAAAGPVTTNYINQSDANNSKTTAEQVKIVYTQGQGNQVMASTGTILQNRLPNGTIGLQPQTVLQTATSNVQTIQTKQPTLVLKTSGAPAGAPGLVTVPMNVTSTVQQANNVGSPSTQSQNILSNLQVVNVRPGIPSQQQKGQPARVVLSAPTQIVGARPGAPVSSQFKHYPI